MSLTQIPTTTLQDYIGLFARNNPPVEGSGIDSELHLQICLERHLLTNSHNQGPPNLALVFMDEITKGFLTAHFVDPESGSYYMGHFKPDSGLYILDPVHAAMDGQWKMNLETAIEVNMPGSYGDNPERGIGGPIFMSEDRPTRFVTPQNSSESKLAEWTVFDPDRAGWMILSD